MFQRIVKIGAVFLLLTALLAGGLLVDLYRFEQRPCSTDASPRVVVLESGQSFEQVAARLHAAGLISSRIRFKALGRVRGSDKRIKAGEYRLASTMPAGRILEILVSGDVSLHRLTIPEGFTLKQIAAKVEESGFGPAEKFMETVADRQLLARLGIGPESLEGYLFPDTYFFPGGATPAAIITAMTARFQTTYSHTLQERTRELGFTRHDIVTLASIIEKETGTSHERPRIASVFHNRLKRGMRLQSDPTVIYGIADYRGNITRKHLRTPTPYNTYVIKGLPPGPIASPGLASIEAALYPEETPYLYFVSKKDGTHKFSTNFAAHNRAVRKYQLRK